jgi:hypothetical protein
MSRWGHLAIVCALSACGSHSGVSGDANGDGGGGSDGGGSNNIDAAIDAPNVKGTVHVQVTNAATALCSTGGGVANVYVLFMDTDGTVTQVTTDTSGNAQGDVFPGGSVTAMCHRALGACAPVGSNCSYTMVTVLDVEPGDNLVLNADAFLTGRQTADATSAGTFTVSYPAYAGAAGYDVYHPCGKTPVAPANATSQQLTMRVGCKASPMNLVVIANNGGGNPMAYTEIDNVTFASGGSATITDTWHTLSSVMATYTNPTTDVANVQLDRFVPGMKGLRSTTAMDGSAVTLTVTSPLTASAAMQSIISPCAIADMNCSRPGSQTITQVVDGASTYTLDLSAKMLPWVGPVTYDVPTTTLHVPATGTGAIDLFEADLQYVRANTVIHIWRVFGPNIMDVAFGALPALPGGHSPVPTDTQSVLHARIGESDAIGGYRPARQNVFDSLETCEQSQSPTAKRFPGTLNRFMRSQ